MPSARTHYELLSVDPSAEPAAIKAAFRDQIARYHPDKVVHLGQEFQDLAAQQTAELTVAYKTLMNPALRVQYDATLAAAQADRFVRRSRQLGGLPRDLPPNAPAATTSFSAPWSVASPQRRHRSLRRRASRHGCVASIWCWCRPRARR